MKKILLTFIIAMFLISFASAQFLSVGDYSSDDSEFEIVNFLGLGRTLSTAKLQTPYDEVREVFVKYVPIGKDIVVMQIEIENFEGNYKDAIGKTTIVNMRLMGEVQKDFKWVYAIYEDVEVDTWEDVCNTIMNVSSPTGKSTNCLEEITGTHLEKQVVRWEELGKDIPKGKITIGLMTDVKEGDYYDAIPTLFGKEIKEWAVWEATVIDANGVDLNNAVADSGNNGEVVQMNYDARLMSFTFSAQSTASNCYLLDANTNLTIMEGSLSGTNCSFSPTFPELTQDRHYYFMTNNTGGWTHDQRDVSPPAKFNGTAVFWEYGLSKGVPNGNIWYEIEVVYTQRELAESPPTVTIQSPQNTTFNTFINHTLTATDLDTHVSSCWYSLDLGFTNTTMINDSFTIWNFTESSILADGGYLGQYYCNDTLNQVTNKNVSFAVDTTDPFVNVTFPRGAIDYQLNSTNITINWSVSDLSLQNCFYDYATVNVTVPCADNNVSINITSHVNSNLTLYANDTAQNQASNFTSWLYRVFEVGQTFSATTVEGSTETFVNTIILGEGETITEINFNYNGTDRSASSTSLGDNKFNLSASFIIPSVSTATNITFFWKVSLSSGPINTTERNQSVTDVSIDDCSSFTNVIFNYTLIDEETQEFITNSAANETVIEIDIQLFDQTKAIKILNFSKKYENINPARVCLSVNLTEEIIYAVDSTVKYEAANYSIEYYNIQNFQLKNATIPQNINLFDLKSVDATEFQITFKDANFVIVEDAVIQINRQYVSEGVFKTVEIPKTDSNGQTVAHLVEKDIVYNMIVLKEGAIIGVFNNKIGFCEDVLIGSCFITLNAIEAGEQSYDYNEDIALFYDFNYNKTSRVLQFDFSTTDGSVKNVTLSALKIDQLGDTIVCDGFLVSASGTILCDVPISVGNETIIVSIFVDTDLKINTYIETGTEFDLGDAGFFLMFFLVLSLALMMTASKTGVIIGVVIGFIAGSLLSFIQGGILAIGSSVVWLIIMGIILIYKLSSQGET